MNFGRPELSLEMVERACSERPEDESLLLFAARHFARFGEFERAEFYLEACKAEAEDLPRYHAARALVDEYRGRPQSALEAARAAFEGAPGSLSIRRQLVHLTEEVERLRVSLLS